MMESQPRLPNGGRWRLCAAFQQGRRLGRRGPSTCAARNRNSLGARHRPPSSTSEEYYIFPLFFHRITWVTNAQLLSVYSRATAQFIKFKKFGDGCICMGGWYNSTENLNLWNRCDDILRRRCSRECLAVKFDLIVFQSFNTTGVGEHSEVSRAACSDLESNRIHAGVLKS